MRMTHGIMFVVQMEINETEKKTWILFASSAAWYKYKYSELSSPSSNEKY